MEQVGEQGELKLGETFSVRNLLYLTLIESSNRAAFALTEKMGIDKFITLMNFKADRLSLENTHFEDSTGLSYQSYSNVKDILQLTNYLYNNYPLFSEIISIKEKALYSEDGTLHHKMKNTNELIGKYDIIGGKTGWTQIARGCLMVIREDKETGGYSIYIILGSEDRFKETEFIINQTNL